MATIEHVVVLMLENRSFDHLFGGRDGVEGLAGHGFTNRVAPSKPASATNTDIPTTVGEAPFAITRGQGPGHSLDATNIQLCGDRNGPSSSRPVNNSGFVMSYSNNLRADHVGAVTDADLRAVMESFGPTQLPVLNALASAYVLCDHWFAEVPGPTMPNRFFMHAATSAGFAHNVWNKPFQLRTIYDQLADAGKSWGVYYSDQNEVAQFSPTNQSKENFRIYDDTFVAGATAGRLPAYSFIIPRFAATADGSGAANSMHAPDDVRPGEQLVAEIYNALRSNAAAWNRTLLVITFDEHGGFFDHVAPPAAPNPDGLTSPPPGDASFAPAFAFDRLGLRVPTILVSPWLPKGRVVKDQLQHTSVLRTVRELFGLTEALTKRDAEAASFTSLLNELQQPRTDAADLPMAATPDALKLEVTHPDHPSNRPLDDDLKALCTGWDQFGRTIDDGMTQPTRAPSSHGEAHAFIRAQVERALAAAARSKHLDGASTSNVQAHDAKGPVAKGAVVTAPRSRLQQYILLPATGLRARGSTTTMATKQFLTALPKVQKEVESVRTPVAGAPEIPMQVLDSMHEDGAKLVELPDEGVRALKSGLLGVRIVPLVYYQPAVVRRHRVAVPAKALSRHKAIKAAATGVTLTVHSPAGPIGGATVVAFTDFAAKAGAQGTTDANGKVTLEVDPGATIERLYVYPNKAPCWGTFRQNVELVDGLSIALRAVDPANPGDVLRHFYPNAADAVGAGVKVAVCDTGVALNHPDLVVSGGLNTVVGENPTDFGDNGGEGHGTHVAGIIAARGQIRGVAPGVTLRSYRVFGQNAGGASNYSIAKAIDAAAQDGCDLINLSLGGGGSDDATRAAIQDAREAGAVCIVASGNDGRQPVSFPANDALSLAISAMGRTGTFPPDSIEASEVIAPFGSPDAANFVAAFSNVGPEIALVGPGVGIVSTLPPNTYGVMDGTSMACPAAVGRAAVILSGLPAVLQAARDGARADAIVAQLFTQAALLGFGASYEGHGLLR
jgi:phospholipase C